MNPEQAVRAVRSCATVVAEHAGRTRLGTAASQDGHSMLVHTFEDLWLWIPLDGVTEDRNIDPAAAGPEHRVAIFVGRVMDLIEDDLFDGVIPPSVRDFSDLHDYVDANMYLEDAGQRWEWTDDASLEALLAETNAITAEVSRRLAARAQER